MHFSIPDLQQFRDDNGIAYTVSFYLTILYLNVVYIIKILRTIITK